MNISCLREVKKEMLSAKTQMKLTIPALVVLLVAGCTTFKLSGAAVTPHLSSYTKVGTFHVNVTINKFLGNSGGATLFNITADATDGPIYDAIQREIQMHSADAAVDVSINYQATFINMLLNYLTAGIYAPATAEISGTLIKYSK